MVNMSLKGWNTTLIIDMLYKGVCHCLVMQRVLGRDQEFCKYKLK